MKNSEAESHSHIKAQTLNEDFESAIMEELPEVSKVDGPSGVQHDTKAGNCIKLKYI